MGTTTAAPRTASSAQAKRPPLPRTVVLGPPLHDGSLGFGGSPAGDAHDRVEDGLSVVGGLRGHAAHGDAIR
eukprot:9273348-Alexandrium_andersonii.AAC.1